MHDGRLISIASACSTEAVTTVYDLRVADHHTYFVVGSIWGWDVWVHNAYQNGASVSKYGPQVTTPVGELAQRGALRKLAVEVYDLQTSGNSRMLDTRGQSILQSIEGMDRFQAQPKSQMGNVG